MTRNPVFESSMKRRMRSLRAPMLVTLYILFLLLVSGVALVNLTRDQLSLGNLRAGLESYIYVSVMQFMLIILVAPALTAAAISGERERQTLDLLLCTRVGAMRIVLGKLLSSVCFLALMIVSSLPVMSVTFFFGGVSLGEVLLMCLFLMVTALACCSIGIFCSAVFRRTVTATVVAYLAIFALGVGTLILPMLFQTQRFTDISEIYYSGFYTSASGTLVYVAKDQAAAAIIARIPKLFYLNPAVGLFALLIGQTGLLQNTFSQFSGYLHQIHQLYLVLTTTDVVAYVNMAVLALVSVLLTGLSALFVKPAGLRVRRKQK